MEQPERARRGRADDAPAGPIEPAGSRVESVPPAAPIADPPVAAPRLTLRQRVAVAMRCAYCRDGVGRAGVGCAAGCGAVYHGGCWDEHRAAVARCATPGCAGASTRPFGLLGWLARLARLFVAALVAGRRAAGHVAAFGGEVEASSERRLERLGRWTTPPRKNEWSHPVQKVVLVVWVPLFVAGLVWLGPSLGRRPEDIASGLLFTLAGSLWLAAWGVFLPYFLVVLPALHLGVRLWSLLEALLRRLLRPEVAALERPASSTDPKS